MRVSCGKLRTRPRRAMRSSGAAASPEKKRASRRSPATSSLRTTLKLLAPPARHHLLEARELVFLHEHGVLGPRIAARAHVVAVVGEALLDDRHEVGVDLGGPRSVLIEKVEEVRADDVQAVCGVACTLRAS